MFLPIVPHVPAFFSTSPLFLPHPSLIYLPLLISIQRQRKEDSLKEQTKHQPKHKNSNIQHTLICIFLRLHSWSVKSSRTFNFNWFWNSSDFKYSCSYFPWKIKVNEHNSPNLTSDTQNCKETYKTDEHRNWSSNKPPPVLPTTWVCDPTFKMKSHFIM